MNITKREFLRLSLGGLVANEMARRIDAAHNIPHVPTVSTVASVHDVVTNDTEIIPDNLFWRLPAGRIDQWDVQPGSIYGRFESHQLMSKNAYMKYDPPYFDNKWHSKAYRKKTTVCIQEDYPPHRDWMRLRDGSRLDPTSVYYRVQRFGDSERTPPEHPFSWDTQFWVSTFAEARAWADANEMITAYEAVDNPVSEWKPVSATIDGGLAQGHIPFSLDVFGGKDRHLKMTTADTNLCCPNELRAPENFATFGISIILDRNTSDADVVLFERNVCLRFMMGQKFYLTEQATRITTRADMDELVDRAGFPTAKIPAKMHRLDPPVIIPHNISFMFELFGPLTDFGEFGGFVWLDGYHARSVC